jgi:hypothetical protein
VYLIEMGGVYKIGHTANWDKRKRGLAGLPYECELLALQPCKDMRALERRLHLRFENRRLNGEWFDLRPGDLAEVYRYLAPVKREGRKNLFG